MSSKSRLINTIMRDVSRRERQAAEHRQNLEGFEALMIAVNASVAHGFSAPQDDSEMVHYHANAEGERPLRTSWPRANQRVLPSKHPIPVYRLGRKRV